MTFVERLHNGQGIVHNFPYKAPELRRGFEFPNELPQPFQNGRNEEELKLVCGSALECSQW